MRAALLLILAVGCSRSNPEVDRLLTALRNGDKEGFELAKLGPGHADGIPAVLHVMESDDRRFVQSTCLEALLSLGAGEEARTAVDRALDSRDSMVADRAALVGWKLYADREPYLDRLLVRAPAELNARILLARAPPLPDDVTAELARTGHLSVLAAIGPPVEAALPRITAALEAKTADERIRAARAHYRVSGRLEPALGVLVEEFRTDNLFLRQRIHAIWADMLRTHPDAMREKLQEMAKSDHEAVRTMAGQMLSE
ncbi:MAG: hypothetical protein ACYTHK_02510 [Planctomycetota bacterium]